MTICTQERACLFGKIVDGKLASSQLGEIVAHCWQWLDDHHAYVLLDAFVVMPNHLHGIILIDNDVGRGGSRTAPTNRKPLGDWSVHSKPFRPNVLMPYVARPAYRCGNAIITSTSFATTPTLHIFVRTSPQIHCLGNGINCILIFHRNRDHTKDEHAKGRHSGLPLHIPVSPW